MDGVKQSYRRIRHRVYPSVVDLLAANDLSFAKALGTIPAIRESMLAQSSKALSKLAIAIASFVVIANTQAISHLTFLNFEDAAATGDGGVTQGGFTLSAETTGDHLWEIGDATFSWVQDPNNNQRWILSETVAGSDGLFNLEGVQILQNDFTSSGLLFTGLSGPNLLTHIVEAGVLGQIDFEALGWFGMSYVAVEAVTPGTSTYHLDNIVVSHQIPDGGATAIMLGIGVVSLACFRKRA